MSAPTREEMARSGSLDELYGQLDKVGMGPGWNKPTPSQPMRLPLAICRPCPHWSARSLD